MKETWFTFTLLGELTGLAQMLATAAAEIKHTVTKLPKFSYCSDKREEPASFCTSVFRLCSSY